MKKRKSQTQALLNPCIIGIDEAATFLSVGKSTARRIGNEAGALVKIGRRSLYRVDKLRDYIERQTAAI